MPVPVSFARRATPRRSSRLKRVATPDAALPDRDARSGVNGECRPDTRRTVAAPALRDASSGVLIVAHDEDTGALRAAMAAEGFAVDDVRGPYTPQQLAYSRVMQALVNHANAWRIAAGRDRPTIVVEPDFVPVKGFGDLPAPVPPGKADWSLAYLYAVGPEVWDLATTNVARGRGGGAVALLIPPKVASLLLQFFAEELETNAAGAYRPWDSGMGYWLLQRGVESYLPYRHFGEHGGVGNPEHARFGPGRAHRADALQGPLAFVPVYARGSTLRLRRTRLRARIWGVLRLGCGRFLSLGDLARSHPSDMIRFAVGRLLFRTPPS